MVVRNANDALVVRIMGSGEICYQRALNFELLKHKRQLLTTESNLHRN